LEKIIINASSNLKRALDLGTKIKSNGWLDIGTEGVPFKGLKNVLETHVNISL
jgi:hypothetical protein